MTMRRQGEVGRLRAVLVKHARDAFAGDEQIDAQWRALNYVGRPHRQRAVAEYDRFMELLRDHGVAIQFLPRDDTVGLDSIYTRDSSVLCEKGAILCNMGKAARRTEPAVLEPALRAAGVPAAGAITGAGRLEGGDAAWIDERTLVVGRSGRTNHEGIRQLARLLKGCLDELIVVELPAWRGAGDVFHLMSILSPVDRDLAVVYSPLMPPRLRNALASRRIELVEVPEAEFETLGCNVLALAPRTCVALEGNPITRERLEGRGARVVTYTGREISIKGCGEPTCLTRPLLREA